uniref:Uncharacterized protein n=1 Tax=Solanum tuberosum TaxID=4113 RepID=M1DHU9_SOLTU
MIWDNLQCRFYFVVTFAEYLGDGILIPPNEFQANYFRTKYAALLCKYGSEKADGGYLPRALSWLVRWSMAREGLCGPTLLERCEPWAGQRTVVPFIVREPYRGSLFFGVFLLHSLTYLVHFLLTHALPTFSSNVGLGDLSSILGDGFLRSKGVEDFGMANTRANARRDEEDNVEQEVPLQVPPQAPPQVHIDTGAMINVDNKVGSPNIDSSCDNSRPSHNSPS